ncbi:MAG TPA: glycosyl hydrolase family 65 protein [Actinomycetes bacterium]|nr:glycosyl hydrolase family 65 protein [Actinomycetes bacterium]
MSWLLRYEGFDPATEKLREALCTLGNGRFATRGAAPESVADDVHYPGTYAAGVFNRLSAEVDGHLVDNESMVNLPDWQSLRFRPEDGDWVDLRAVQVSDYVQELDLRRGVLTRRFEIEDRQGRRTAVAQRRFVSMHEPVAAGIDSTFVALNWSGRLVVRTGIDGRVSNAGVPRYVGLGSVHLVPVCAEPVDPHTIALDVRTTQSAVQVSLAARARVLADAAEADVARELVREDGYVAQDLTLDLVEGQPWTVEKVAALYTSRDRAISEPASAARQQASNLPGFEDLLAAHVLAWDHRWERCDLTIQAREPDRARASLALHVQLFHVLQTVSEHVVDLDVGIPARGLHGEAYRGHIFWDEMFVYPFLHQRMPELSRSLLLYRWRRLPQARRLAREAGLRGAAFPWQSGSDGREETQAVHLNPRSGRWLPDHSRLQRHINVAVAFSTWQYYEATADLDFLAEHGAELMLEIAAMWASLATYDRTADRYDIRGVMGPDEFHDAYPWRDEPGIDNNAYTNVMVAWSLERALRCVRILPTRRRRELLDLLGVSTTDLEHWDHVSRKLRLCWHGEGILSQFEGYERLEELAWADYVERYGDIARLDRILEAEGDTTNRYRLSKQADVLMLFYLLSADDLAEVLERLGYRYDPMMIPRTIDYYLRRTTHGSTLSKVVHAWVLARSNRTGAWQYLLDALESDLVDTQGGTTPEGVHIGAMAGSIDLLQRAFTGLETRGEQLWLNPVLPDQLTGLQFRLRYREHYGVHVAVDHDRVVVGGSGVGPHRLHLRVRDEELLLDPGGAHEFALGARDPG